MLSTLIPWFIPIFFIYALLYSHFFDVSTAVLVLSQTRCNYLLLLFEMYSSEVALSHTMIYISNDKMHLKYMHLFTEESGFWSLVLYQLFEYAIAVELLAFQFQPCVSVVATSITSTVCLANASSDLLMHECAWNYLFICYCTWYSLAVAFRFQLFLSLGSHQHSFCYKIGRMTAGRSY